MGGRSYADALDFVGRDATPERSGAARPVRAARPVCPTWNRVFDAIPASPLWVGVGISAALVGAFGLLDWIDGNWATILAGEVPAWMHVEVRNGIATALLVAGIVVTHRYEELGIPRDVFRLAPQLQGPLNLAPLEREVSEVNPLRLRIAGALGAVLMVAIVPTLYLDPSRFLLAATYAMPSVLFDLVVGAVVGWTLFKTLFAAVEQDRAFANLSQRVDRIDLLDLDPMRPFARRGQRRALRFLLLAAIGALVFVDAGLVAPPALVFCGVVAFAMFSFLLPVNEIHRRIHADKQQVLDGLREDVRREYARLHHHLDEGGPSGPDRAGGYVADLLAYEARIAAAREWPLDTSLVLRTAFFLLLPLGSWLGGAFVERLVDAALG
jgi:hypothetical protein